MSVTPTANCQDNHPSQYIQLGLTVPVSTRLLFETAIWRDVQVIEQSNNILKSVAVEAGLIVLTVASVVEALARLVLAIPLLLTLALGREGQIFYLKWIAGTAINVITIPVGVMMSISNIASQSIAFGTAKSFTNCCIAPWLAEENKPDFSKISEEDLVAMAQEEPEKALRVIHRIQDIVRGEKFDTKAPILS